MEEVEEVGENVRMQATELKLETAMHAMATSTTLGNGGLGNDCPCP